MGGRPSYARETDSGDPGRRGPSVCADVASALRPRRHPRPVVRNARAPNGRSHDAASVVRRALLLLVDPPQVAHGRWHARGRTELRSAGLSVAAGRGEAEGGPKAPLS